LQTFIFGVSPVLVGSSFSFQVNFFNGGPVSAHGVVATIGLQGVSSFVSLMSSYSNGTIVCMNSTAVDIECSLPVLLMGDVASVIVNVVAPSFSKIALMNSKFDLT
jgi:hypothetical protein